MNKIKQGQKKIIKSKLITVKNKYPERDYEINITLPEFTCLCPISGYPDFAVIKINYIPDLSIIELKSLKLYINKYRNREIFHEEAVNKILNDLIKICSPRKMDVTGDFNPRGNVKTIIKAVYEKESKQK